MNNKMLNKQEAGKEETIGRETLKELKHMEMELRVDREEEALKVCLAVILISS